MKNLCASVVNAQTNATTNFPAITADQLYVASFIASFSDGAAAGTLKVQGSNDPNGAGVFIDWVPTNWVDVPSATVTVAAGATSLIAPIANMCYRWLRLVWTRTGGAGTLTVNINAQSF